KHTLTPTQLAAERLERRFGREITTDKETFERLTATIVRQVGDLRRMVDEFSNFARMPKPVFRDENVHDIARQALFLHEVAHPAISFSLDPPSGEFRMVSDRRTEPYMTTRVRGTGLGLAIVNKIVEEHMGEIAFLDRPGGGTHVRISFDTAKLAALAADPDAQSTDNHEEDEEA